MTAIPSNFTEPHFGNIPLACVIPSKTNPRKHFNETDLAELAESIKNHGVAQPILVRPLPTTENMIDCVEIVAGERRFRASKLAGMETIPAIVRELTDVQALEIQIIENLQRKDVHEIEEAEGYDRLMKDHGYTADQLADKVGKSRSYIYGRLKFCALAPAARQAFFDGHLSASTALLVARIPVESLQEQATKEIVNDGEPLTYRAAFEHIQLRYMLNLDRARFSIKDAKLVSTAGSCEACPKRTGNQPMIFEGVSADVCTDPNCFASKSRAHDDKVLATAQKKGVPVYEGEEAKEFAKETKLLSAEERLWRFERQVDGQSYGKSVEELLPPEQLPKPAAFVRVDGKVKAMYEPTAMQAALEKAGICESEEAREKRAQEQLAKKDPAQVAAEDARRKEAEARSAHREAVAEQETNARLEAYKQIRAKSQNGLDASIIRVVLKALLGKFSDYYSEYSLPDDLLRDVYTFDTSSDEAITEYIDQADPSTVMLLMMDAIMSAGIEVMPHNLNDDLTLDEDIVDFKAFDALVDAADIDMEALRTELQPTSANSESETESNADTQEQPAEKAAKEGKKKSGAKVKGYDCTAPDAVAWPFPKAAVGK